MLKFSHCLASKLRYAQVLMLVAVLLLLPSVSLASDAFTGYQIDNHGQYFAFLGVRTPLVRKNPDLEPFVQLFAASLAYKFKSNGDIVEAQQQWLVPSVGLKQRLGPWSVLGFVGAQLRHKEQDQPGGGTMKDDQAGVYVQGEAFYWNEKRNFHGILSYSDLDQFYWGRVRGKHLVYRPTGCCPFYAGAEIAGMGNKDFYAVQTGPVFEVAFGVVMWAVRGGYQYSMTFQNGVYGGTEFYIPF
jgi:hypothetical protein